MRKFTDPPLDCVSFSLSISSCRTTCSSHPPQPSHAVTRYERVGRLSLNWITLLALSKQTAESCIKVSKWYVSSWILWLFFSRFLQENPTDLFWLRSELPAIEMLASTVE